MAELKNAVVEVPEEDEEEEIDLVDAIQKDIEDEESDNGKYMELAKIADEKFPCRGYGSILRTIAKEEAVHHKHLKAILADIHKNQDR